MKTLIIAIATVIFSVATINTTSATERTHTATTWNQVLSASDTIYSIQQYINPLLAASGRDYFDMTTVKELLGDIRFNNYVSALNIFFGRGLVFINLNGEKELNINQVLRLKYGKRFASLPTYVKTTDKTTDNKKVLKYKLFSYTDKIQRLK